MWFEDLIERIDRLVWGPLLLGMLMGTGVYLSILLKFLSVRRLKTALKYALGLEEKRETKQGKNCKAAEKEQQSRGRVSSFSSLTTELAATIGTGNIIGVSTAMVLGGPGALFWMVITSIFGMATKLVESSLAVRFRVTNKKGQTVGGPMYVMEQVFPIRCLRHVMAWWFAFLAVCASFGMGNMVQANSIAEALFVTFHVPKAESGLILSFLVVLIVLGGISVIGKVTQYLVPFMGILYLSGIAAVLILYWKNIPLAIGGIISAAFCPGAVSGGIFGQITISAFDSMRWGISRGIFSNEAGLGATGITAAAANTEDPVRQGYISMTGVFLDTVVICTATGLALAASGVFGMVDGNGRALSGAALTMVMFQSVFGEFGGCFMAICIVLFAFATIIGWAYQGERAFEFLMRGNTKHNIKYRFIYGLIAFPGCIFPLELVWNISDICNGLMAFPNLICVLSLSGMACEMIVKHEKNRIGNNRIGNRIGKQKK